MARERSYQTTTIERGSGRGPSGGGLFPLLLIAGVGYFAYKKFLVPGVIKPLQVKKEVKTMRVEIVGFRIKGNSIEFDMLVLNPNTVPLILDAVMGNVFIVDQTKTPIKIGYVSKAGPVTIKAAQSTKITFAITLKAVNTIALLLNMEQGKITSMSMVFDGAVSLDKKTYPVRETYKIS